MTDEANPYAKYVSPGNPYAKYSQPSGTQTQQQPPSAPAPSLSEALTTAGQADYLAGPSMLPTSASVLQGALDLPEGIMQAAGINLSAPLRAVQQEANRAYAPKLGEAVGAFANPVNWFFPEARLPGLLRAGASAVRGGLSALFTPQEDASKFWKDAPTRTAVGTALGGGLGLLGAPTREDVTQLLNNDIRVTPSSMVAGRSGSRVASWLPGVGEAVQHGENVTLGDYNRRLFNWALDGMHLDPRAPLQAGSRGLNYVYDRITSQLNQANAQLTFTPYATQGFSQAFVQAYQTARAAMTGPAFAQYQRALDQYFTQPVNNANAMLTGKGLADVLSNFRRLARDQMRGNNLGPDNYALAEAYRDMANTITHFSQGPPEAIAARDAATQAFAKYMVLETAAGRSGVAAEGVITPRSFLSAQQSQIGRSRFQRDAIPFADSQAMKDLSEATNRVLGPTSGSTAQHVVPPLFALEYLREGAPYAAKVIPAALGLAAAHTGPGMRVAGQVAQSPVRGALPGLTGPLAASASDAANRRRPRPGTESRRAVDMIPGTESRPNQETR